MDTPYSTLAIKYVGSTPALEALDALRTLQEEDNVRLGDAAAVTRSTGGELNCYPIRIVPTLKRALGGAVGGLLLGFFLGRRPRWALLAAAVGAVSGWFVPLLERQRLLTAAPFVEKNESVLYMQIQSADWPKFQVQMRPYLARGLPVIQDIAPGHFALHELFAGATELQVPTRDEFPEPPTMGSLVPEEPEDAEEGANERSSTGDASPEQPFSGTVQVDRPSPEVTSIRYDDFTQLQGIGPVYRKRLHDSGVHTFGQLADLAVDELAELVGAPASRVRTEDWIGQAAARSSYG